MIAQDNFARTVASGIGSADIGGAYSLKLNHTPAVSVSNGALHLAPLLGGGTAAAYLPVTARDVLAAVTLAVPTTAATPTGLYSGLVLRRQSDGSAYRVRVAISSSGEVGLRVSYVGRTGAERAIGSRDAATTLRPGQKVHLETSIVGTSPVTISVRAWSGTAKVPTWQLVSTDTGSSAITSAGSVGLWSYLSSTKASATIDESAFKVTNLAPTTAPTSTAAPSSKAPSSVAPSAAPSSVTPSSVTPTSKAPSSVAPSSVPTVSSTPTSASSTPTNSAAPTSAAPTSPIPTPPTSTSPTPTPPTSTPGTLGAEAIGTSAYPVPANAIYVSATNGSDAAAGTAAAPLQTVVKAVSKAAAGQTIVLRAGTYHEDVAIPASKSGITIEAYPDEAVWFDGTTPVTTWTQSGNTWVHSGWTAQFDHSASFTYGQNNSAFINPAYPMAAWPDQVYFGSQEMAQVASASQVTAGTFYVDYASDTLTVGSNPNGQAVRASDLSQAFLVQAANVTLEGFGVRHYATPLPALGTVRIAGGSDTLRNVVVTGNATQGVSFGLSNDVADHITSTDNGMTGVHGNMADGLKITNSAIDDNNAQHFNAAPSAAGIKITRTRGLTISNNDVSGNIATTGIWMDESTVGLTVTGNTTTDNGSVGIQAELSDTGVIANNTVTGGARGIYISDTGNIKIFNNYFANNTLGSVFLAQDSRREANASDPGHDPRQPIPDPTDPWLTRNVVVDNNVFAAYPDGGEFQFYALDRQTNIPADDMNITINGNLFHTRSTTAQPHLVGWGGSDNHTVVSYDTPAALAAAKNASWVNDSVLTPVSVNSIAVPLPSDVAADIGQSAGVRQVGTF